MPSDLQVSNIKDLTGSNTGLSIASDGQVTIAQNNPTVTLGSNTTFGSGVSLANASFPAGHIVNTSKEASMSRSGHIQTSNSYLTASGIIVSSPATSGSNYNLITFCTASYLSANSEMSVHCYVSYNGGGYAILGGSNSSYGPKNGTFANTGHRSFSYTWIDTSGSTSAGTNLYQIYFNELNTTDPAYLTHSSAPFLFMVQEVQV